jgi:restriction endonuclease Mrr
MGNLLIAFSLAVVFGFVLIFFIQKTSKRRETAEEKIEISPELQGLNMDQFFSIACELLEKMGLKIVDTYRTEDNEIEVYLENPAPIVGGPLVAHLILYPEGAQVTSMDVMNFSSDIVGERRGKGILITTGFFAPDVAALPELPPIEFIDGKRLAELMKQHGISRFEISKS